MAHDVDPFIVHIPKQFREDPEVSAFFDYLVRFNHDMWKRTGGGVDSIDELYNINTAETTPTASHLQGLRKEISYLESRMAVLNGQIASLQKAVTPAQIVKGDINSKKIEDLERLSIIVQG